MQTVRFADQASANRFASEVRRLYGAERWGDLAVRPRLAVVVVPEDLPHLTALAQRFGGVLSGDGASEGEGTLPRG